MIPMKTTTASCGSRRKDSKDRLDNAPLILSPDATRSRKNERGRPIIGQSPFPWFIACKRPECYLPKKISRNVPVISFLNSSSDGLSMKTIRGATLSASLIGG